MRASDQKPDTFRYHNQANAACRDRHVGRNTWRAHAGVAVRMWLWGDGVARGDGQSYPTRPRRTRDEKGTGLARAGLGAAHQVALRAPDRDRLQTWIGHNIGLQAPTSVHQHKRCVEHITRRVWGGIELIIPREMDPNQCRSCRTCFWIGVGVVYPIRSMFARRNLAPMGRRPPNVSTRQASGLSGPLRGGFRTGRLPGSCRVRGGVRWEHSRVLRREGRDAGKCIEFRDGVGVGTASLDLQTMA